jgi:antitoxin VapB
MALSIKTKEADELARWIAHRTGETMTEAVTVALRERKERLAAEPSAYVARAKAALEEFRKDFDFSTPITKADFDALWEES